MKKGKITLISKNGNALINWNNINGQWSKDTTIIAPSKNSEFDYHTFVVPEYVELLISGTKPTLLFTADFENPNEIQLISNEDPLAQNSEDSSSGLQNEMSIINVAEDNVICYSKNYESCEFRPYPCELNEYFANQNKEKKEIEPELKDIMVLENEDTNQSRQ